MSDKQGAQAPSPPTAETSAVEPTAAPPIPSVRRKQVFASLKLLIALLVIAAPVLIASQFVTGVIGVAYYGVLAAAFGWIAGGPKTGAIVVAALSVLGAATITLSGHTWALALILLLLGVAYGYGASRGVGSAVVQLPILTPYFMMDPPGLFNDPPVIGPAYLGGVVTVMMLSGLWTVLILGLFGPSRTRERTVMTDRRMPIVYGTILGLLSVCVMLLGTTTDLKSHWVWVTLTLYVLADPARLIAPSKMVGRILGTLAGFGVVTLLTLTGLPDNVLQMLALPALWLCIVFMLGKKPYWEYTLFLTVTVVLMNSYEVNTLLLDAERFGFTIIGAVLSIFAAILVNLLHYHRRGLSNPTQAP